MNQVIEAIYENGVFKPLLPIDIEEHEVVAIKVIHLDEWQARFASIIEKFERIDDNISIPFGSAVIMALLPPL